MAKFVCVKKCYFRARVWVVGETLETVKGEKLPKHFEAVKKVAPVVKEPEKVKDEPQTMSGLNKAEEKAEKEAAGPNAEAMFG